MSLSEQLTRIRANAVRLSALPQSTVTHVFGGAKHKFKLNAVASENEVSEYEKKYQFSFPEGYREFLLQIGDGGAGPFYGIKQRFSTIGSTLRHEEAKHYSLPSVYTTHVSPNENWKEVLLGPNWQQLDEDDNSWALYSQGNLVLADVGCGAALVLVLNGPLRGHVIHTDFGCTPPYIWEASLFLDFYESWQNAVLSGKKGTGFGF